jgi:hypothetical protein
MCYFIVGNHNTTHKKIQYLQKNIYHFLHGNKKIY